MNVYDFDHTIYNGDSTIDFYFFCLIHHPKLIFRLPTQLFSALQYILKRIDKTSFKQTFFCFLQDLDTIENDIEIFWDVNQNKIKQWYIEQQEETDLIISASPYFLLKPLCDRLKIHHLLASFIDTKTGQFLSRNCYGFEKVFRYRELYNQEPIHKFYSDSISDQPMADISKEAFIVKKNTIKKWEY